MKAPVVLFIFNRPDTTEKVFQAIRKAKPAKLLVVADGPRLERQGELERCEAARAIIEQVDWDCEVLKNYSDINLGCHQRIPSGLNWVFNTFEEAIILEDDCLPHPIFFQFCEELLTFYREQEQIMHIAGFNVKPQPGMKESFYVSRIGLCWGWATWRRAWASYDPEMKSWQTYKIKSDLQYFGKQSRNVYKSFEYAATGSVSCWDVKWGFSRAVNQGLSLIPKTNLIQNIGFREDATHTTQDISHITSVPVEGINLPLVKPHSLIPNRELDEEYLELLYQDDAIDNGLPADK
ncbi:glycosyltransferase family 2 protein [Iningainema tapete]|uniref:Glycosyltransferase family 2 protein n=1 Tax=Iningainema tapete BLCC-T55 TaxID=2748662 RepID=A0A8J7C834_9CYAN|nr:glycosyltransferase family 2 protein [Iningainema tapete]MBD2776519.1 glycosyltransferase family 2 protein [Iningainema tapete BLCC-T55]